MSGSCLRDAASTALRLLRTLEANGFAAKREDGLYRPGFRMVQLGVQALSHESLVATSQDALRSLVARTGESAYLSVAAGSTDGLYLAIEEGTHTVRHINWVGRTFPMVGSAAGEALQGKVAPGSFAVVAEGVEPDITAVAAPVMAIMIVLREPLTDVFYQYGAFSESASERTASAAMAWLSRSRPTVMTRTGTSSATTGTVVPASSVTTSTWR